MKESTTPILLVDSPEKCADLRHASGFWAPDPVVYLHTPKTRVLMVSMLEQGRALQLAAASPRGCLQVVTPDDLRLRGKRRRSLADWAVALLRREGIRRVRVPPAFPLGTARRLEACGITVRLSRDRLFPSREIKTAAELELMRQSQRAAVAAMAVGIRCIRAAAIGADGRLRQGRRALDVEDVKLAIHTCLLQHNASCRDLIVAPGRQAADPHERGHGPLRAGETIVLDVFPQHAEHGYWGDLTRTVVRGQATPEARRLYEAVKAAQAAALRAIRGGVACATVHAAVQAVFARRRFDTQVVEGVPEGFIHSTGHGVGLEIHESPSLAPVEGRLRAGQVVTVEPGLYYPKIGGVRIEDTVHVTARGWDALASCPHVFEV